MSIKHTEVKSGFGGHVPQVRRGKRRRRRGKPRGWLCAAMGALAFVLLLDFGLFSRFQAGIAEDGVKNGSPTEAQGTQEPVFFEMPAILPEGERLNPVLLDEAPEDQLCIGVLPTETGGRMKYYVPDEETRQELYNRISSMDVTKLDSLKLPPDWVIDAWDYNISVKYGEYSLHLKEGGVMRIDRMSKDYTSFDEWAVRDEEVAGFILDIVKNKIGMNLFDVTSIKDIVEAEIMTGPLYTGEPKDSVVLTDREKLAAIENLFTNAEKSFWSKCPFGNCQMALTTATGEKIVLALACDSCTAFYVDGCFYDYMPAEYRGSDGDHPHNDILFDLFGISSEYFLNT